MTTFVAALHLPYTVRFIGEPDSPRSQRSRRPSRRHSPPHLPVLRRVQTIELPPSIEVAQSTPYEPVATPVPNLLQSLGHSTANPTPTPPMTPSATPAEELFFQLHVSENAPLGSPSDPSIRPMAHKVGLRRNLKQSQVTKSTRISDPTDYFGIPTSVPATYGRPKRGSSASEASQRSRDSIEEQGWKIERTEYGNGGLKNAVEAAIEAGHPSETVHVGTLGFGASNIDDATKIGIEGQLRAEKNCMVVFASDEDFDGHYNHFCKEVLWPVFHYQIPDHPKSKAFLDHSWEFFVNLNQAVADVIIKDYKRDDTVWVNDYHLCLVPKMVRDALGQDARIGFFLHVGFPSSEIFRCLAHRAKLLEGILGSTLVGFQTDEYARHFLTTCSRLLNVEARNDGVLLDNRFVKVVSLPIGIDPVQLEQKRRESKVAEWADALRQRYAGKMLLVARDKLDGVRGVRQKLLAYELFLKKHPEWVGKVVLIQVALTTTSIVEQQSTVIDIVTRINCMYATLDYQPVVYLHQDITYHQYIALLENSDALVVTSLRDGMNLTSHEFVYLQNEKHAPLILSEFTGSASVFGGSEISVNPWDFSRCAEAFQTALTMPAEEKEARWKKLYDAVMRQTAAHWFTEFLSTLDAAWKEQQRRGTSSIPRLSMKKLVERYEKSESRLFFLDYEGTLVSWGAPNSNIITSPQRILDIINDLLEDPANIVYIMSSRPPKDLEQVFLRVPGVGLCAEGGCFVRPFQDDKWTRLADEKLPWKKSVRDILDYYVERTPGTFVEERNCSYVWHHEKAEDPVAASRQAGDCCNHVNDSCDNFRIHAVPITGGVLVESLEWSKVAACKRVMEDLKTTPGFLFVAGDNRDDEPVFEWANEVAKENKIEHLTTVRVGTGHTLANATTPGVAGVVAALQKLASISFGISQS